MDDPEWDGPVEHGFVDIPHLLVSIGDLDRFLTRKQSLCILRNPTFFAQYGNVLDASNDRNRPGILSPLFFLFSFNHVSAL